MRKIILGTAASVLLHSANSTLTSGYGSNLGGGCNEGRNYIVNGNFNQPSLSDPWEIINSLPGWETDEIEIGVGNTYNDKWGNTLVAELDGNRNDVIKQSLSLTGGSYNLCFRWAARTNYESSSAMSIYWNGQKIFEVTATDDSIHSQNIPIMAPNSGNYVLQIRGEGPSDTYGIAITDIRLTGGDKSRRSQEQHYNIRQHSQNEGMLRPKGHQDLKGHGNDLLIGSSKK